MRSNACMRSDALMRPRVSMRPDCGACAPTCLPYSPSPPQEFIGFAIAEGLRNDNTGDRIYPGGSFDPMGMSKDAKSFEVNKLKEIKNGR